MTFLPLSPSVDSIPVPTGKYLGCDAAGGWLLGSDASVNLLQVCKEKFPKVSGGHSHSRLQTDHDLDNLDAIHVMISCAGSVLYIPDLGNMCY